MAVDEGCVRGSLQCRRPAHRPRADPRRRRAVGRHRVGAGSCDPRAARAVRHATTRAPGDRGNPRPARRRVPGAAGPPGNAMIGATGWRKALVVIAFLAPSLVALLAFSLGPMIG